MDRIEKDSIRSQYSMLSYKVRSGQNWWKEFMGEKGIDSVSRSSSSRSPESRNIGQIEDDIDNWEISENYEKDRSPTSSSSSSFSRTHSQGTERQFEAEHWLGDTNHGYIRVYDPDTSVLKSRCIPCSLSTTAHQICLKLNALSNALHIQYNGGTIKRLEPYDHPLALQNEYLTRLGYTDICRIQEVGQSKELGYLIRFYVGKPTQDGTFSRNNVSGQLYVRKGKVFHQWAKRFVALSGTRLLVYPGLEKRGQPHVYMLAKGKVEEMKFKNHERCLKITAELQAGRTVFLSFGSDAEISKWLRKCMKAVAKLPNLADLSNNHLEYIPENLFVNDRLSQLNLRHNALKERPIEEDIYTIGWVDDLPSFQNLHTLNLSDNDIFIFPSAICHITTLQELNVSSNKIEELPPIIAELTNLRALHLHNNHLSSLPSELANMKQLSELILAFNRFSVLPEVLSRMNQLDNIVMTGNYVERLPGDTVSGLKHVQKMDFRLNCLTLPPVETMTFELLEHLTHLDVSHNRITNLDVRNLTALEYLNCEHNKLVMLQVSGQSLKHMRTAHNSLQSVYMTPLPENLRILDLSHNELNKLPEWICDLWRLEKLLARHNRLSILPNRLLCNMENLKLLMVDHNQLTVLPEWVENCMIETLHIEYNRIAHLPDNLLVNCTKLRILNATNNRLTHFPPLNQIQDLNKVSELYLSCNYLVDSVFEEVCEYPRLKILHMAYNDLQEISHEAVCKLEVLEELNVSGNKLQYLPDVIGQLPKLIVLRAHSNILRSLPDFYKAVSLKVLDVGCNQLHKVSVSNIMASQLKHLDVSCNSGLQVSPQSFQSFSSVKNISLVDMTGRSRSTLIGEPTIIQEPPWSVGFSETSGSRNKLCITQVRIPQYGADEALFGMFDGGRNNEAPLLLQEKVPTILRDELNHPKTSEQYMKYTMLTAHRKLKASGQRLGAATVLCHLHMSLVDNFEEYILNLANVGHVEVILCRQGEPMKLTRLFTVAGDPLECERTRRSDGIITEDNKVNGNTEATRLLGCSYLYPAVVPDPHVTTVTLRHDDELIIIANSGVWQYVSYEEAVAEIREIQNPVLAAKKLQDIAQSYGSKENLSVMVIRLNLSLSVTQRLVRKYHQRGCHLSYSTVNGSRSSCNSIVSVKSNVSHGHHGHNQRRSDQSPRTRCGSDHVVHRPPSRMNGYGGHGFTESEPRIPTKAFYESEEMRIKSNDDFAENGISYRRICHDTVDDEIAVIPSQLSSHSLTRKSQKLKNQEGMLSASQTESQRDEQLSESHSSNTTIGKYNSWDFLPEDQQNSSKQMLARPITPAEKQALMRNTKISNSNQLLNGEYENESVHPKSVVTTVSFTDTRL